MTLKQTFSFKCLLGMMAITKTMKLRILNIKNMYINNNYKNTTK